MKRFLSSTTLSATNFSSRRLASALRYSDARTVTCIATAFLLGGALFAGQAFAASPSNGASDTSFSYSQVEADPLAPVAALSATRDSTTQDSATGYSPPEYDGIRTIEIDMAPRAFNEKSIEVYKGETVRFVLRNSSPMSHEFTIGTSDMQDFRRRFMSRVVKAEHQDIASDERDLLDNWNAIVVLPGESRELVWTFDKTENIEFGCNIHGHYEAGMKGHFTTIATEETITAENAEADPLASEAPATVAAAPAPVTTVAVAPVRETTVEPAVETAAADDPIAPPAPPAAPALETAEVDTVSPETQSADTQTTIISPAAVTSATETPARLEPGLDIISPNISAAEFAALINSGAETLATDPSEPDTADTADVKAPDVKTASLSNTVTDASGLDGGADKSATRKTVAFASGTLPDNGLDFPGVRRTALPQPATSQQTASLEEPSLQELARLQSTTRYEAEQQEPVSQNPAPATQAPALQTTTTVAPVPKPASRQAALNAEGLDAGRLGDEGQATETPARKKFAVLSIRDHMRMGKMREQALLSRSLELRAFATLAPAPTQLNVPGSQLSVPAKRQPTVAVTNFSSAQYGGDAGRYNGEIVDKGDRGVPVEVETLRKISDSTIRTLDNAGSALLRTAGSFIKRVGLDDEIASVNANISRDRPALVEEYGSGEFGESKK